MANYGRTISPEDVAKSVFVSPYWFRKIFAKETGKTVIGYINEVRIEQAKILLKETALSITEIANRVGFNNLDSFEKSFQKIVQKSPKKFRENA